MLIKDRGIQVLQSKTLYKQVVNLTTQSANVVMEKKYHVKFFSTYVPTLYIDTCINQMVYGS